MDYYMLFVPEPYYLLIFFSKFEVGDDESKRPSRMQQQSLNSELILSKEQLYDMFQQILAVKKFEHQVLFNALQLDSNDEQAAAIRRELDGRMQKVSEMEKVTQPLGALHNSSPGLRAIA